jgi:hypothetical protein
MNDEDPSALDLNATMKRMEPGVSPISEVAITSIAISMKRIADSLDRVNFTLDRISYSTQDSGNKISNTLDAVKNAVHMLNSTNNQISLSMNALVSVTAQKGN